MPNPQVNLYCPNCGSANLESDLACQQCHASLPKRYLWAVGSGGVCGQVGDRLGDSPLGTLRDRFLWKAARIVLDTQPGQPLPYVAEIPALAQPYLRLFAYRLHISQLFTVITGTAETEPDILLLENPSLSVGDWLEGQENQAQTLLQTQNQTSVPLEQAWAGAGLMRQMHWLWQMVHLWQPLSLEGVTTSLLTPQWLRVEGPILRILQLSWDESENPTLSDLGKLWLQWLPKAHSWLKPRLDGLCEQLITGKIQSPEVVIEQLDEWLTLAANLEATPLHYQFHLATLSDQGLSRKRNEDACYPDSGSQISTSHEALTIVCDGVGGHAGGDVAANLAITALRERLTDLQGQSLTTSALIGEIETAICRANDLISQRNDTEHRHERQRMGTTLVMVWVRQHQVYVAHVGDSRIYWINRHGCYQVTLDDDVASREVRLGYALYRDALDHPLSGSLIQALGMGDSHNLHPTIQRFILDEDGVFLLCSDGLSDYDRVEEAWQTEILPILTGETNVTAATSRLIELANLKNGHDNITVSLLHCQVSSEKSLSGVAPTVATIQERTPLASPTLAVVPSAATPASSSASRSQPNRLLLSLVLLAVGGLLVYLLAILVRPWVISWWARPLPAPEPVTSPAALTPSLSPASPSGPDAAAISALPAGTYLQVNQQSPIWSQIPSSPSTSADFILGNGSIVQVEPGKLIDGRQQTWRVLRVCFLPATTGSAAVGANSVPKPGPTILQPRQVGWVKAADIPQFTLRVTPPRPEQQQSCK